MKNTPWKCLSRVGVLAIAAGLSLGGSPAQAIEAAFVTNFATSDLSVVDLQTATVALTMPAGSRPGAVAIGPDDLSLYVAARNDLEILDVLRPQRRVDVDLATSSVEATGVAVTRDGAAVFVTHRTTFPANQITMINLRASSVAACVANRTASCLPGTGEVMKATPFGSLEHVAVSPWDGSIWIVNTAGQVARAVNAQSSFFDVPIAVNQRPLNPSGMIIGTDGNVAIAANGNCGTGPSCVKVIVPGMSNLLVTRSETFPRLGRIAHGPGSAMGIPLLLAVPPLNQLARIAAGPTQTFATGPNPVAAGAGALGTLFTVNENTGPGNGTVSVLGAGAPRTVTVGSSPKAAVSAAFAMRGMLRAEQGVLSWTLTPLGGGGPGQIATFRNRGFEPLTIQSVVATGLQARNFGLLGNTCTGATLAVGATCDVTVTFTPSLFPNVLAGSYRATLQVQSTASHAETVSLIASRSLFTTFP